jgi:hypothetical protein
MTKEDQIVGKVKSLTDQSYDAWNEAVQHIQLALATRVRAEQGMSVTETNWQYEMGSINKVIDLLISQAITLVDEITTPLIEAIREIQSLPYGVDDDEVGNQYPESEGQQANN